MAYGFEATQASIQAFQKSIADIEAQISYQLEKIIPLLDQVKTLRASFATDPTAAFDAAGKIKSGTIELTGWLKEISGNHGLLADARHRMTGTGLMIERISSNLNAILLDLQHHGAAATPRRTGASATGPAPLHADEGLSEKPASHKRQRSNDTVEENPKKKNRGLLRRLGSKSRETPTAPPERTANPVRPASLRPRTISFAEPVIAGAVREYAGADRERRLGPGPIRSSLTRRNSEKKLPFGPRAAQPTAAAMPASPPPQGTKPDLALLPGGLSLIEEVEKALLTPRGEAGGGADTAQDTPARTADEPSVPQQADRANN